MKQQLVFTPIATVTYIDGEVESVVIDWSDSYCDDETVNDVSPQESELYTSLFDQWIVDHSGVRGQLTLFENSEW